MAIHSLYQALTKSLSPRLDVWVRRVFGAGQAAPAVLSGGFAVRLILELHGEIAEARSRGGGVSDAGGAAFALVVYALIPMTVLLAFGAVSVWRNWTVKWWLPLLVMVAVGVSAAMALT